MTVTHSRKPTGKIKHGCNKSVLLMTVTSTSRRSFVLQTRSSWGLFTKNPSDPLEQCSRQINKRVDGWASFCRRLGLLVAVLRNRPLRNNQRKSFYESSKSLPRRSQPTQAFGYLSNNLLQLTDWKRWCRNKQKTEPAGPLLPTIPSLMWSSQYNTGNFRTETTVLIEGKQRDHCHRKQALAHNAGL